MRRLLLIALAIVFFTTVGWTKTRRHSRHVSSPHSEHLAKAGAANNRKASQHRHAKKYARHRSRKHAV